ncbi:MAG: hypothetical protein ABH828_05150 [archaeon]
MNKYLRNKLLFVSLFFIVLIVLLLPSGIRKLNHDPLVADGEFYYDLRVSKDLSKNILWDSFEDRIHKASLFYYVNSVAIYLIGTEATIFISLMLGLLSFILFYNIIKLFFEEKETLIMASSLFILSPIFIYLFVKFSIASLATVLSLTFIYFYIKKSYWSVPFLILISITDFSFFLVNIVLMMVYYLYDRKTKLFLLNIILSLISLMVFVYVHRGFFLFKNLFLEASFGNFFTSFGAVVGISFFYLFLGIIGLFTVWKRKKEFVYMIISMIIILIFSFFNSTGRIFLNMYLSIFAGLVITFLLKRRWALYIIKRFTLLLIFCVVIFSTTVYIDQLVNSEPKQDIVQTLQVLKSFDKGVVFSHEKYGSFIEYYANKNSFVDEQSMNYNSYSHLKNISEEIFLSRNLEHTKYLLNEENIKYIIITPEMKKGLVWKREGEGLIFLLENSNSFSKLKSVNGVELWVINSFS